LDFDVLAQCLILYQCGPFIMLNHWSHVFKSLHEHENFTKNETDRVRKWLVMWMDYCIICAYCGFSMRYNSIFL